MLLRKSAAFGFGIAALSLSLPLSAFAQTAPSVPAKLAPVTVGRTTVAWTPENGLSLAVDGVPVVRKSTLYVVKAGWTGTLLDQRKEKPVVAGWTDGPGGTKSARVTLENASASATYTFMVAKDATGGESVDVDLAYRLKQDVPAEFEYGAGYVSAPVLQGSVVHGGPEKSALVTGEVSVTPPPAGRTQEQNRLLPPFNLAEFSTRLGKFTVNYSGTAPLPVIFDGRGDEEGFGGDFPVFWMGIGSPSPAITVKDGERHARFKFTVGAPTAAVGGTAPAVASALTRSPLLPDAYLPPQPATPLIIPRPKELTVPGPMAPLRLSGKTRIVLNDDKAGTKRAAAVLQRTIQERFGLNLPIGKERLRGVDAANGFYVGVGGKGQPSGTPSLPVKPEGYTVSAGGAGVYVAGVDEPGVLWGAQTVVQLLSADADGPLVRPAVVRDWPSLAVRSVHLFTGKNALPFHQKLIDRIYSRFKMNGLFIQAEQARWDADPEVAPNWAGTKEQLKQEVAYARERGITVYPLLQSYGHMEWLFNKQRNREFAEDPETPYAVDITNPKAVAYLERFNAEADDTFGAPAFHAGLDEVTMRGRFPFRSKPREFADLFVTNAKHWHQFFTKRGKQMWMWADMALHPSEVRPSFGTAPSAADAAKVRAGLPKDIVMVDWQYTPYDSYPSLKKLKDAGFKNIVAATWFNPENIRRFSKAAAEIGGLGAMQTTWAGYESNETVLSGPQRKQFTTMVLAAEYFWNGGEGPTADKLPYDYAEVFAREFAGPNPADFRARAGYALRLGTAANQALPDFLGYGGQSVPADLPTGPTRGLDGTQYHFESAALVLASKLGKPGVAAQTETTLTLPPGPKGEYPREVRLLLSATHTADAGTNLGTLRVERASGKTDEIPLVYGTNIASWDDASPVANAPVAWRGVTKGKQPILLRRLNVTSDAADPIKSVRLVSANGVSAPALFAATAFTD